MSHENHTLETTENSVVVSTATVPTNEDAQAQSTSTSTILRKEDFHKIVEDPYFKYLVDKTARSQTWAFLVTIGSVIAAILVYAGWEFKSAKGEIDKAKSEIRGNVVASQHEVEKAKTGSQEAHAAASSAQTQIESVNELLTRAQAHGQDSERQARAIIQAAQDHINASSVLQERFFESQKALIQGVSKTTDQANENVKEINKILAKLNEAEIPQKLEKINEAKKQVDEISEKVTVRFGQVEKQVSSLNDLQNLNYELIKARSLESVTLRAHQSYVLQLPDLNAISANPNAQQPYLWVTFSVEGLGKHFELSWKVQNNQGDQVSSGTQPIDAPEKRTSLSEHSFILTNTPYQVIIEYANFGLFANDFVVLKVRPQRGFNPAIK